MRKRGQSGWSPREATEQIRAIARSNMLDLAITNHAKEQLEQRGLIVADVRYVLKQGFVYEEGERTTRKGCFKYKIECSTPNSGERQIRVVVTAQQGQNTLKIVTVMWVDGS